MTDDEAVAAALLSHRETAGLSQQALADRMQGAGFPWHQQTVDRLERGRRRLTVSEERELARIFGVAPDWAAAA